MSNDLISRSAVMDYLRERQANVIIEKNKTGFVLVDVCDGMNSAISAFMNFIVQLPTAYDVDKVVERLKERRDNIVKSIQLNSQANDLDYEVKCIEGQYESIIELVRSELEDRGK